MKFNFIIKVVNSSRNKVDRVILEFDFFFNYNFNIIQLNLFFFSRTTRLSIN